MFTRLRSGASASRPRPSAPRSSRKPRGTDAETTVAALTRELDEARQQQAASADVLKVISRSTYDLQSVFQAILANATRLCEASYGAMWLREGDRFRNAAFHGALPAATRRYSKGASEGLGWYDE